MQYFATVQSIAQSAQSTLVILDKQARKDCTTIAHTSYSVYCLLTSPAAIKRYKIALKVTKELLTIAAMIAIAIWTVIREQSDRLVESCLEADQLEHTEEPIEPTKVEASEVETIVLPAQDVLVGDAPKVACKSRAAKKGRSVKQGFVPVPKLA